MYPLAHTRSFIYSYFGEEKAKYKESDLGTACILLLYGFLCFSVGEVNASLIKSVSHSSGFYSVVGMWR